MPAIEHAYQAFAQVNQDLTLGYTYKKVSIENGVVRESEHLPLVGVDDPLLQPFTSLFNETALQQAATAQAQLIQAAAQNAAALAAKDATIAQLQSSLNSQVSALNDRIQRLAAIAEFNPRIIKADALVARINSRQVLRLATSDDVQHREIAALINQYDLEKSAIHLDSEIVQNATQYLLATEFITEQQKIAYLRDGTRDEAYIADA